MNLYFADTADRVNTNDPHFIPLVSRAQPYLVSKSNTHGNHGYESAQSPSQQYQSSYKREEPRVPSKRTRTLSNPEEESTFNVFSHSMLGKDLHDDEEQSAGPPLHSPREVSFATDPRLSPLTFPPAQDQQSQTVSSGFKFTTDFQDLENFLNNENIENFFQMRNFYHKNKKLFSFPSNNVQDKFSNFGSEMNYNNLLGNSNTPFGDESRNQLQLSFPDLRKFGSVFNFPQISRQTVGNKQNNPAVQNNNNNYHNNFNSFNLPQSNSPFNQLNQVPWTNPQKRNLLFPPSSFGESFNTVFKEFNTPFPPTFGINRRSTAKSRNYGGFKGQRGNQFRLKDVLPPRRNRVPLRRYQQQNNFSPRQSHHTANNHQGGIKFNPAQAPFRNYNTDKSYNSQQIVPYANKPANRLPDRGLKSLGQERPSGGYISGPTLLRTAILDANVAGIDGVSDLYDWLGSDEPLIQKFQ